MWYRAAAASSRRLARSTGMVSEQGVEDRNVADEPGKIRPAYKQSASSDSNKTVLAR